MEERERCYSFVLSRTPHKTNKLFTKSNNINVLCIKSIGFSSICISNFQLGSIIIKSSVIHCGFIIFVNNNIHKCREENLTTSLDVVKFSRERVDEISCVELESSVTCWMYQTPSGDFAIFQSIMDDVLNKICGKGKRFFNML
jgi:hypothetical protein